MLAGLREARGRERVAACEERFSVLLANFATEWNWVVHRIFARYARKNLKTRTFSQLLRCSLVTNLDSLCSRRRSTLRAALRAGYVAPLHSPRALHLKKTSRAIL
jgi:hypothetical protein